MSNLEYSKHRLALGITALSVALAPLGCSSTNTEAPALAGPAAPDNRQPDDDDIAEVSQNPLTLEDPRGVREANQSKEDAARENFAGDAQRQAQLSDLLKRQLPARIPTFDEKPARTRLAELSGVGILGALGYSRSTADVGATLEGDKAVFDDGALRLRTSRTVPGYFKFADRGALYDAHRKVGHVAPAPTTAIESAAALTLDQLGVPRSEILRVRAHAVTLDTGARGGETNDYGTAAFVSNVQRQVGGLPVLGSACTLAFDIEGTLTWARCRWPQFYVSPKTDVRDRDYEAIVSEMARQLDWSLAPSASATAVELSAGFAYEERVTEDGVEYEPVLRTILSSPGQAAGEFTALVRERAADDDASNTTTQR